MRRVVLALALILTALPLQAQSRFAEPAIGSHFPPVPAGALDMGGSCTGATPELIAAHPGLGAEPFCATALHVLGQKPEGPAAMVIASRRLSPAGSARALWEVTDTYPLPAMGEDSNLEVATCTGLPKGLVAVAVVRWQAGQEQLRDILWSLALDVTSGRFVVADNGVLSCPNPMP